MEHSHRFFSNKACMHFPCHSAPETAPEEEKFNCLFCYCPLYPLGDDCGGVFTWVEHKEIKIKLCMDCGLPHQPEYYDTVINKLTEENITKMFR